MKVTSDVERVDSMRVSNVICLGECVTSSRHVECTLRAHVCAWTCVCAGVSRLNLTIYRVTDEQRIQIEAHC